MPGSCPVKQLTETQSRQKGARKKKTHPFTDQSIKPIGFSRTGGDVDAAWHSSCKKWNGEERLRFSLYFQQLRHRRRNANSQAARKTMSWRIRKVHRSELRSWKSKQLQFYFGNYSTWETLRRHVLRPSGQQCVSIECRQSPISEVLLVNCNTSVRH